MWFVEFLKDFIGTPAILVGLFVLFGNLLQRKSAGATITSVFKIIVAFLVMGGGAGVLVGSLAKFGPTFNHLIGVDGVIPQNEGTLGWLSNAYPSIVQLGAIIMIFAMIVNLLLARISRFKYVFLSGHVLFYMSVMLAGVFGMSGFDYENSAGDFTLAVASGALLMGTYMVLQPASNQRWMKQITKTDVIAMGHTGGFGYAISGLIGDAIGKFSKGNVRSTEEIKFPKGLAFFRNTTVSIALSMILVYLIIFIPEGIRWETASNIEKTTGEFAYFTKDIAGYQIDAANHTFSGASSNWLVVSIVEAFKFAAGIEIILLGVRTIIAEIVPSFKGISKKLVKDARASLDCPIVFPYAPNAVLIGFLSALVGGVAAMGITFGIAKSSAAAIIVLPSIMNIFFQGATSAVFGNVKGGIWGAILAPFIQSLLFHLVPLFFVLGEWISKGGNLGWGDTDYAIGFIPGLIGKTGGETGKWLIFGTTLAIALLTASTGFIAKKAKPMDTSPKLPPKSKTITA